MPGNILTFPDREREGRVDAMVRAAIATGLQYTTEIAVAATQKEVNHSLQRLQMGLEIVVSYDEFFRPRILRVGASSMQAKKPALGKLPHGWQPQFDAQSPDQEQLARQYAEELRTTCGLKLDPARILEIAESLYRAEADFVARSQPQPQPETDEEIAEEWGL